MAAIAEISDEAMNDYLDGTIYGTARLLSIASDYTQSCGLYPALKGSAKCDEGIEALLDAIVHMLPPPAGNPDAPVCGVVFDVDQDPVMGLGAHIRLFSGTL